MSHRAIWTEHCRRGELAYPLDAEGRPFWRPSVRAAQWRVSAGLGTVHATTVVHPREGEPYNVCLVELDEGFRMMSAVHGIAPRDVTIGRRVRVVFDDDVPFFEVAD